MCQAASLAHRPKKRGRRADQARRCRSLGLRARGGKLCRSIGQQSNSRNLKGAIPPRFAADLEQAFTRAGIGQCRIVAVEDEQIIASAPSRKIPFRAPSRSRAVNRGVLLLVGAAIWAVWFFWKLMGPE